MAVWLDLHTRNMKKTHENPMLLVPGLLKYFTFSSDSVYFVPRCSCCVWTGRRFLINTLSIAYTSFLIHVITHVLLLKSLWAHDTLFSHSSAHKNSWHISLQTFILTHSFGHSFTHSCPFAKNIHLRLQIHLLIRRHTSWFTHSSSQSEWLLTTVLSEYENPVHLPSD